MILTRGELRLRILGKLRFRITVANDPGIVRTHMQRILLCITFELEILVVVDGALKAFFEVYFGTPANGFF